MGCGSGVCGIPPPPPPVPGVIGVMEERHFAGFVALLRQNECMMSLGAAAGNPDWINVGRSYVDEVCQSELLDWGTCQERYRGVGSRLWVLEEEGVVVGSVGAVIEAGSSAMELVRMYVDASQRGRGLGRRLVEGLLQHAGEVGATSITLTTPTVNAPAIGFYERMGFTKKRAFPVQMEGVGFEISELAMAL